MAAGKAGLKNAIGEQCRKVVKMAGHKHFNPPKEVMVTPAPDW